MKKGVSLCLLLGFCLVAGEAAAQDPSFACNGPEAIVGTVAYNTAVNARKTHAQIYGAIQALERRVFPRLYARDSDEGFVMHGGSDSLFGAVKVPSIARGDTDCPGGYGLYDYDLYAVNFALGYRTGPLTLFYSASGNLGGLQSDAALRYMTWIITSGVGYVYALGAPFFGAGDLGDEDDEFTQYRFDYVAGFGLDLDYLSVQGGYLASENVFFNVLEYDLGLFASSVFERNFSTSLEDWPYFKAGLRAFEWLEDSDFASSAYVRKLQFIPPAQSAPEAEAPPEEPEGINFWSGHIEQRNLFDGYDLLGSYAYVDGDAFLHDLRVAWHSDDYHQELTKKRRSFSRGWEYAVYLGVVNLPNQWYYGVEGGYHPQGRLDLVSYSRTSDFDDLETRISLGYNDVDTLDIFPYAVGAWSLTMYLAGSSW